MVATAAVDAPEPPLKDLWSARNSTLRPGDELQVEVVRDDGPNLCVSVPYSQHMRVLDVLQAMESDVAEEDNPAFRWLCGSKMCGTCAVRVNGREVLACWEPAEPAMRIEPLRNFPVVADLVVDRTAYEKKLADLRPWFDRQDPYPGFPEPLRAGEMRLASEALNCINCAACYSACPVVGLGDVTCFAGPALLVQFGQTALDPRNDKAVVSAKLSELDVFECVSCYKCEEVCPQQIPIVSHVIEPLKRLAYETTVPGAEHSESFLRNVARFGVLNPFALVLQVRRAAAFGGWRRAVRLLLRGKLKPLSLFRTGPRAARSAAARFLGGRNG